MNLRGAAVLAGLLAALPSAGALDLRQHSDSASKQFSIFCEDAPLRGRVASFAEEVKHDVLQLLGERDAWQAPVVIVLQRAAAGAPAAQVRLLESLPGFKVQIDVGIGDDPAAVNLQKQIVRAVLLEYAYRETGVQGGTEFREAPWWVIEGCIQLPRQRASGPNSDLFKRLLETNKLPPLANFLVQKPDELGGTVRSLDRELAGCLVQLLTSQPGGRPSLARLVRAWPQSNGDPLALLKKEFPTLAADEATLQKWWTLQVARLAAADRSRGLSLEDTAKQLTALLTLEIPTGKDGGKKTFAPGDFAQYLKLPASRAVLADHHTRILALSARAHVLLHPALVDAEQALALLARGKTAGVAGRLARLEEGRASALRRADKIADYLNWFEATQSTVSSHAFDEYLRTAREISEQDRLYRDPIARYLDAMEHEY